MIPGLGFPLWAVHISDGLLLPSWLLAGAVLTGFFMLLGAYRLREEHIPQTALLAAAFFVASQFHVRVGPSSAHLLLNGLVGVMLGRRAGLAIPLGLALQALLFGHGGFLALGVNAVVLVLPALVCGYAFVGLHRRSWFRWLGTTTLLVLVSGVLLWASVWLSLALLWTQGTSGELQLAPALDWLIHPLALTSLVAVIGLALWLTRSLRGTPEFALGLLLGEATVLLTLILHTLVLLLGTEEALQPIALVILLVHLPVAALEGVLLGFTVGFLVRVKPEMLGLPPPAILFASPSPPSPAPAGEPPCARIPVA